MRYVNRPYDFGFRIGAKKHCHKTEVYRLVECLLEILKISSRNTSLMQWKCHSFNYLILLGWESWKMMKYSASKNVNVRLVFINHIK